MITEIKKRDGRVEPFDANKIVLAISKAMAQAGDVDSDVARKIASDIANANRNGIIEVEQIQDMVEDGLMASHCRQSAKAYIKYREKRNQERKRNDDLNRKIEDILLCNNVQNQNANVDEYSFGGRKFESANVLHKDIALNVFIRPEVAQAHRESRIYIHDLSDYDIGSHNCLFVDLQRLLNEGFATRNGDVRPANSFSTACQLIAVIFQIQSQVQYGGVATCHADYDLAPFVKKSFYKHYADGCKYLGRMSDEEIEDIISHAKANMLSTSDECFKQDDATYRYATDMLEREGKQAAQSLYHNLNTLESRAGSQIPFTSINFGTDTSVEGRMVSRWLMEASIAGIGKYYLTPIFPISILKHKNGVNAKKGDPNYDIKQLAIKSLSQRIYPNIVNCDFSQNIEDPDNPDTEMATMGCVHGDETVTYKIRGQLYVEPIRKMWERLGQEFPIKKQGDGIGEYMELDGAEIFDTKNGFVKLLGANRNRTNQWLRLQMSGGRVLQVTPDHPLPTNRGIINAEDISIGDKLTTNYVQSFEPTKSIKEDIAWFLGIAVCDGCWQSSVAMSFAASGEDDIVARCHNILQTEFDAAAKIVQRNRGANGKYIDLIVQGDNTRVRQYLSETLSGPQKKRRLIPEDAFRWTENARLSLLAGMIDADGYINKSTHGGSVVQIGSTNKMLALQQMALAQSLGMPSKIYVNHYTKQSIDKVRYRVEFSPTIALVDKLTCAKKRACYLPRQAQLTYDQAVEISAITTIDADNEYSYDVTTSSGYFEVSGIYSHNCRTMMGYDRNGLGYSKVGRGNVCPTTMNLPKIGIKHGICLGERQKADLDGFWAELDEVLRLTELSLVDRFYHVCNQSVASAKFMYQNGTIADFDKASFKGIYEAMKHGTLAVGYIGIAEMCQALFGKDHSEDDKVWEFALSVVEHIYHFCQEASERHGLNVSCYSSPAENLCKTYAQALRKEFGEIPNVTDREYITNSHHVPVWQKVSIYRKLELEAPFCKYPTGGCITYIELESAIMQNHKAIEDIIDYAMSLDIPYLAFNFPIDTCLKCGYQGEIDYNCPKCGNTEIQRLRRVTGLSIVGKEMP